MLPYGMFLTFIFKKHGVVFKYESILKLKHYNTYNEFSLQRMGYIKINGHWTWKGIEGDEMDKEKE